MTNQEELEIAQESIALLQGLKTIVLKEIEKNGKCLNVDFHAITLLDGIISHQKHWLSHYRFEVALGRSERQSNPKYSNLVTV